MAISALTSQRFTFACILATVSIVVSVASLFGFLTPDSWKYLDIANSINQGLGCSINQQYFAMFPCGYPALIAGIAKATGLNSFYASKLCNGALLLASAGFFYRTDKNFLLTFFLIINPITLGIAHFTWSENALLLAIAMVCFSIHHIHTQPNSKRYYAWLLAGLLLGISSRYFFAPFAFITFIMVYHVYGKTTAWRALPMFVISALAFGIYYIVNSKLLGFGTGLARIPAQESLLFLTLFFIATCLIVSLQLLLSAAPLMLAAMPGSKPKSHENITPKSHTFLISLGVGFLLWGFISRALVQYDLFSGRTLGFGLVFIISPWLAQKLYWLPQQKRFYPALAFTAILSLGLSQIAFYKYLLPPNSQALSQQAFTSYNVFLANYQSQAPKLNNAVVVGLNPPKANAFVDASLAHFYGANVTAKHIYTAPYRLPETPKQLQQRLNANGQHPCFFDFTRIHNRKQLQKITQQTFVTGIHFKNGWLEPSLSTKPWFHPKMASYLNAIFSPSALVPCNAEAKPVLSK